MEPTSDAVYERWRGQIQNEASQKNQYQTTLQAGLANQYRAVLQPQYAQAPPSGIKELKPTTIPTPESAPMKPLKFIIFYALVAFTTFSWFSNHADWTGYDKADRAVGSALGSVFWPIYLSGKVVFTFDDAITGALPRVVEWWNAPAPGVPQRCYNPATHESWAPEHGVCIFREKNGG